MNFKDGRIVVTHKTGGSVLVSCIMEVELKKEDPYTGLKFQIFREDATLRRTSSDEFELQKETALTISKLFDRIYKNLCRFVKYRRYA